MNITSTHAPVFVKQSTPLFCGHLPQAYPTLQNLPHDEVQLQFGGVAKITKEKLTEAIQKGDVKTVEQFIQRAPSKKAAVKRANELELLYLAVGEGQPAIVKQLINLGVDVHLENRSPLARAMISFRRLNDLSKRPNYIKVIQLLIQAKADCKDLVEYFPINLEKKPTSKSFLKSCIQAGFNPHTQNEKGQNLLDRAIVRYDWPLATSLLKLGVKPTEKTLKFDNFDYKIERSESIVAKKFIDLIVTEDRIKDKRQYDYTLFDETLEPSQVERLREAALCIDPMHFSIMAGVIQPELLNTFKVLAKTLAIEGSSQDASVKWILPITKREEKGILHGHDHKLIIRWLPGCENKLLELTFIDDERKINENKGNLCIHETVILSMNNGKVLYDTYPDDNQGFQTILRLSVTHLLDCFYWNTFDNTLSPTIKSTHPAGIPLKPQRVEKDGFTFPQLKIWHALVKVLKMSENAKFVKFIEAYPQNSEAN